MPRLATRFRQPTSGPRRAAIGALVLMLHGNARADNPGYDRPGLGFSPGVLQAGDITWEQGLPDWSRSGDASLYSMDALLRLGLGGPLELQWRTSYNRLSVAIETASGRGDSSVGLKIALPASGNFSWGLLGSVTATDGARRLRGEDRQYLLAAAFNWQLDPLDALGAYVESVHSNGSSDHLAALNTSRSLTESIEVYAELAWQRVADIGDGSMAGAGLTWQLTPRVQLDGSLRHRVGGVADTWQAGFGVSVYLGRE